jgi:hypothetical protein
MGKDFSAELFGSPNASPSSGVGKDFSTELFGPAKRTTGEAFTDVGAGLVSGIGSLVQLPSQLYGLATGDFSDTGLMSLGKGIEKQGEEWKSRALKEKEVARAAKIQEAEKLGFWEEFKTGAAETIKDPALLTSFLAEQLPQLLGSGLIGKGVKGAVLGRELAKGATREAAESTAISAGVRAGVGTGAVQQGADIGAGTYEETYNELRAILLKAEQSPKVQELYAKDFTYRDARLLQTKNLQPWYNNNVNKIRELTAGIKVQ